AVVVGQLDGFEAGDEAAVMVRNLPRRAVADEVDEGGDVSVGGAATAAHQVEPAGVEEAGEGADEDVRSFGVFAVLVRQAGVRHAGDAGAADLGKGADVIGHQLRAGGAVEADVEQVGVEERDGERFGVLAAEHGAGGLDGGGDGDGDLPAGVGEGAVDADQGRFDVAGVLRGLDEQVD